MQLVHVAAAMTATPSALEHHTTPAAFQRWSVCLADFVDLQILLNWSFFLDCPASIKSKLAGYAAHLFLFFGSFNCLLLLMLTLLSSILQTKVILL